MLENQFSCQRYGNQQTSEGQFSPGVLFPLTTSDGLKILNPITKEIKSLLFQHEQLLFDWGDFLEKQNKEISKLSVTISLEDGSKLVLRGDENLLAQTYEYTVGKYIFKRGKEYVVVETVMEDSNSQIRKVLNKCNGQKYFEKVILFEANLDSEQLSMSNVTLGNQSIFPEEIQIILDLHRTATPHLLKVDSVFYDGAHYSYIYSRQNDYVGLIQYYNSIHLEKQSLLIHIAKQLMNLLLVLEEKSIVFPNLNHKSLQINPQTHEIIMTNYNQAFYCNKIQFTRKGATFGYAPPEYYQVGTQITSKANIFQAGVLLYYLLYGHSPYGINQQDIRQNCLKGQLKLLELKKEKNSIFNFIELLLEKTEQKRPTANSALKHLIFAPQTLQKISKKSINFEFRDHTQFESTDEFQIFSQISNVQAVRMKITIVRRNGI